MESEIFSNLFCYERSFMQIFRKSILLFFAKAVFIKK